MIKAEALLELLQAIYPQAFVAELSKLRSLAMASKKISYPKRKRTAMAKKPPAIIS